MSLKTRGCNEVLRNFADRAAKRQTAAKKVFQEAETTLPHFHTRSRARPKKMQQWNRGRVLLLVHVRGDITGGSTARDECHSGFGLSCTCS